MARYVFITGGVVSSLGKGLASAALGALLQARGYTVRLRKPSPYLNVDHGRWALSARRGVPSPASLGAEPRPRPLRALPACRRPRAAASPPGASTQTILDQGDGRRLSRPSPCGDPHVTGNQTLASAIPGDVDFVLVEIGGTVGELIEGNLPVARSHPTAGMQEPCPVITLVFVRLPDAVAVPTKTAGEMKTQSRHSTQ